MSFNKTRIYNLIFLLLVFFYFASRFLLINTDAVFFDSQEYIDRLASKSYINALSTGHLPLHFGYIMVFWPIFHVSEAFLLNPFVFTLIGQIILSVIGLYCFYKYLYLIFNWRVALLSVIFSSLLPIFVISSVTFMMDVVWINFYLISLFLTTLYSKRTKMSYLLYLGSLFFGIALVTQKSVLLWLPAILFTVYYLNSKQLARVSFFYSLSITVFSIFNGYLISAQNNLGVISGTHLFWISHLEERVMLDLNLSTYFIIFRNILIPLLRNNTPLLVVLAVLGCIKIYNLNKKIFVLTLLWITPAFVVYQWWDAVFFGRHALATNLFISCLAAYTIYQHKFLSLLVLIYLSVVFLPQLVLLKTPSPYIIEKSVISSLSPNGILIESHFARPQTEKAYKGTTIYVNEPGFESLDLEREINEALNKNLPVFVSSQALSEPYGLYTGPYLHMLSLSYKKPFVLKDVMSKFNLKKHTIISKPDNLIIYKIEDYKASLYPKMLNMKFSKRRIDYYDPFLYLWWKTGIKI